MSESDCWLVVGLANPGPQYAGNRHNVGAMALEVLADRLGGSLRQHKARAAVLEGRMSVGAGATERVVLTRPGTYMNESGGPVAGLVRFFSVDPSRVVVLHDELDLSFAQLRVKQGGGEGGHNGLRSVSRSLGTKDYLRVRVGIGRPPGRMDPADFVLRDFSSVERKELPLLLEQAADVTESLVQQGLLATQNAWHHLT